MHDQPDDLSSQSVSDALGRHWHIDAASIEYAPVGFGSHHWRVTAANGRKWFVTADRVGDNATNLEAAYLAAHRLQESGLQFVVAPTPDSTGNLLQRIDAEWVIAAFEHVEGAPAGNGAWPDGSARVAAASITGRLHASTPHPALPVFGFEIEGRDDIFASVGTPWRTGPYGELARDLLLASRAGVERLSERYDLLVDQVARAGAPWVVSHGEPHSGNFIAAPGGLRLIDWDTVRLAPAERDLAALPIAESDVLDAYLAAGGPAAPRPDAMELFRAWWVLTEISIYAGRFRAAHTDMEDARVSWRELRHNLELAAAW